MVLPQDTKTDARSPSNKETTMYQPGMDRQLAQVYYNDMLQNSASKPAARKLSLALAAAAPLAALVIWLLIIH